MVNFHQNKCFCWDLLNRSGIDWNNRAAALLPRFLPKIEKEGQFQTFLVAPAILEIGGLIIQSVHVPPSIS